MKAFHIDVSPEGELVIKAIGFKGKSCELESKAFEEALGKVTSRKRLPEFYQQQVGQQKVGGS